MIILHTDLLRNKAGNGGGIYAKNAKVNMEAFTSIYGCNAISNGGGVYLENSTIKVNNGALIGVAHVDMGAYEFVPEPGFYLLFIIFQLFFIKKWEKIKQ